MTGQKDITEIFKEVSYDDLKVALGEWLNPEEEQEQVVAQGTPASGTGKVDDVNEAFDDLFNS